MPRRQTPDLDEIRNSLFGARRPVPKGTADVVMERLFPEKRSRVVVDEERRRAVFAILVSVGAINEDGEVIRAEEQAADRGEDEEAGPVEDGSGEVRDEREEEGSRPQEQVDQEEVIA